MNKNIIIVLVGGFFIALLVALMVNAALSGKSQDVSEEFTQVQILVAAKNLSVGRELKEGDLKWQQWPEDSLFVGAIMRDGEQLPTEAMNGKLLRSMVEGQPVHSNMLSEEDKGEFLSANVGAGMRAVGVEVKKHVIADRLFKPGDYVDVIMTYRVRVNTRSNPEAQSIVNRYASETVIENVRILAIDTNDIKAVDEAEKDGKKKKKKSSRKAIVTLEVNQDNAEKLVLSDRVGTISFALRGLGDEKNIAHDKQTTDVGMSQVLTDLSKLKSTSSAVRVYNGNQVQEVNGRRAPDEKDGGRVDFDLEDSPPETQTIIIDPAAIGGLINEE